MTIDPYSHCNFSIQPYNCTLETCCLAQSSFNYLPNHGANLFFAVFFGLFIIPQAIVGVYYRTWGFLVGMIMGLFLEVLGYASRVVLHNNPWAPNMFLIYLITVTIAPVFLSAGIYLCLTRVISLYGVHNSRFAPRTIAIAFMSSDFLSLVLQAAGGGIADTATTASSKQSGVNTMIAGLFLQVLSLAAFLAVGADFAWRCSKGVLNTDAEKRRVRQRAYFKAFIIAMVLATVAIFIRSIFRVAELWEGFSGSLWNDETDFLVLDGFMIAIASICLMVFHPGPAFAGQWSAANWTFKKSRLGEKSTEGTSMETLSVEA